MTGRHDIRDCDTIDRYTDKAGGWHGGEIGKLDSLYFARRALLLQEIQYDKVPMDCIDTAAGCFGIGKATVKSKIKI